MNKEIMVEVNEKRLALPDNSRISDALAAAGFNHVTGTIMGIVMGREEAQKEVATEFRIITSKGELRIELTDNGLKQAWLEAYGRFAKAPVRWGTGQALAFGPIVSGLAAGKSETDYSRWDVIFGTGGYDPKNTYLILAKADHRSDYGVKNGGRFARIISGKNVLNALGNDDYIERIEPVIKLEKFTNKIMTTDTSLPVEDGMEIYTFAEVELIPKAKDGAELFYAAVKDGSFKVDFTASSFASTDTMLGEICPYENLAPRSEGTISIRTDGSGRGRIYISRRDMTSNIYHSIVGRVTRGLELIKIASAGQKVAIRTVPGRLSMLGYGMKTAGEMLTSAGIKYEFTGYQGEDAIVVEQSPKTTMEITSGGSVTLKCIPANDIVEIKLYYDMAPQSAEFFLRATGLKEHAIGSLSTFFKFEDTLLFKGKPVAIGELIPENKPSEGSAVPGGEIGLTNTAAKHAGMIGVRFRESAKFGPTAEKYSSTNILGRVIDMEKMRKVKEKDMVYFKEV